MSEAAAVRIVVLRALGLGDFLTAVPALRGIRRAFPDGKLLLGAPRVLEPLARLSGAVDEVHETLPLAPLARALHDAHVGVNLHGCGPQSHRALLAARPQRFIAFRHPDIPESRQMPEWREVEHERERWCRLCNDVGISARGDDFELDVSPEPRYTGCIVLHAGAASEARRWPIPQWVRLARRLRSAGERVVFTGSESERARCNAIAREAGIADEAVLAGKTDLLELARTVRAAKLVVCGDTGLAHVASATATPSVLLFGPTTPERWGPPQRDDHRVLWRGTLGDPHADVVDPGLASIDTDEVWRALVPLLERKRAV